MLDNYNELREGMLAQCDKPAFPDQCLYAEADDPQRFKAYIKKIKDCIKRGDTSSKRFQDYLDAYNYYVKNEGWEGDPEIDTVINKRSSSRSSYDDWSHSSSSSSRNSTSGPTQYDKHHTKVEVAGAAVGALGGGYLGHKLGKKLSTKIKSERGKKISHVATTIAGAGLGGYVGYKTGRGFSKGYLSRSNDPGYNTARKYYQKSQRDSDINNIAWAGASGGVLGLDIAASDIQAKRLKGKKITKQDWKRAGRFTAIGTLAGLATGTVATGLAYDSVYK